MYVQNSMQGYMVPNLKNIPYFLDVDGMLYYQEYRLRESKKPQRIHEDLTQDVSLGTQEEPVTVKINKELRDPFTCDS